MTKRQQDNLRDRLAQDVRIAVKAASCDMSNWAAERAAVIQQASEDITNSVVQHVLRHYRVIDRRRR